MGVTEFVLECTYSYKYGCFYYTIQLLWWLIGHKSLTYMYREALKIEAQHNRRYSYSVTCK